MKAVVYDEVGGPEVLRYAEVAEPAVRRGGVVIEVKAIGLQGGDLINRRESRPASVPHIVGYQASGTVREIGEGVEGFSVGQRVVAMMMHGSHAELASVPARKTWPIPDSVTFEAAAAIPVEFGTADDCLFEFGRLQPGETVLVQAGSGGVGVSAIQLAKAAGATVISTAEADGRLERLGEYGMDHGIDYLSQDVPAEVLRLTDGRGADLVIDPIGGRALEGSIAALAYRGRISWFGNAGRDTERPDIWPLMEKNGQMNVVFFAMEQSRDPDRTYRVVARIIERVGAGELRGVVDDHVFPLADAADAHRYAETGKAFGRIVIVP
ncbi:MAG: zinc-binding dehydrogenase [Ilumatobacteraceae bacterium]